MSSISAFGVGWVAVKILVSLSPRYAARRRSSGDSRSMGSGVGGRLGTSVSSRLPLSDAARWSTASATGVASGGGLSSSLHVAILRCHVGRKSP